MKKVFAYLMFMYLIVSRLIPQPADMVNAKPSANQAANVTIDAVKQSDTENLNIGAYSVWSNNKLALGTCKVLDRYCRT